MSYCPQCYVGEAGRKLGTRQKEHQAVMRRHDDTSLVQAYTSLNGHNFDFDNARMITDQRKKSRLQRSLVFRKRRYEQIYSPTPRLPATQEPKQQKEKRDMLQGRNSSHQQHQHSRITKLEHYMPYMCMYKTTF